jgi:hypothetical protein
MTGGATFEISSDSTQIESTEISVTQSSQSSDSISNTSGTYSYFLRREFIYAVLDESNTIESTSHVLTSQSPKESTSQGNKISMKIS